MAPVVGLTKLYASDADCIYLHLIPPVCGIEAAAMGDDQHSADAGLLWMIADGYRYLFKG